MTSDEGVDGLDNADLILVLLAAETSDPRQRFRVNGITRLEKILFLLERETDFTKEISDPFTFEPYHYGPYSKEVYDAVTFLKSMQLLREKRVDVKTGMDVSEEADAMDGDDLNRMNSYVERQLTLTEDGKAIAQVLSRRVSPEGKETLTRVKDRFGRMPLSQLLHYVYSNHPEFASKSRIREDVLGR